MAARPNLALAMKLSKLIIFRRKRGISDPLSKKKNCFLKKFCFFFFFININKFKKLNKNKKKFKFIKYFSIDSINLKMTTDDNNSSNLKYFLYDEEFEIENKLLNSLEVQPPPQKKKNIKK